MSWVWRDLVDTYLGEYRNRKLDILDVGGPSGCEKEFENRLWSYSSLNVKGAGGSDVISVAGHPYDWSQVESNSFDVVVSKDTFEHIPFFWASMFEIGRVMKNGALAFIHVPSAGPEHPGNRPPGHISGKYEDCWRVFADGLSALCRYIGFREIEVFTNWGLGRWGGSFLVMQKPWFSAQELERFYERGIYQKAAVDGDFLRSGAPVNSGDSKGISLVDDKHTSCIEERKNAEVCFEWYRRQLRNTFMAKEPYYYFKLGQLCGWKGYLNEAIESLVEGVAYLRSNESLSSLYHYGDYDANLPSFLVNLVEAYFRNGDSVSADAYRRELLSLPPQKGRFVYFRLANVLAEFGEMDDAIAAYDKAIEIEPRNLHCYVGKSNVYFKNGEVDRAIETVKVALSRDPEFSPAVDKIAMLFESIGETDRALDWYKKLIRLQPANKGISQKVEALRSNS